MVDASTEKILGLADKKSSLHWVLWTSLPITKFDDAWDLIHYHGCHWLIKEFHKGFKTGCRLESPPDMTAHFLESAAALSTILAVQLDLLKTMARTHSDVPTVEVIPTVWLRVLHSLHEARIKTIRNFLSPRRSEWLSDEITRRRARLDYARARNR